MHTLKRTSTALRSVLLSLFLVAGTGCNYLVNAVRYATQETYISGKDTKSRISTAALIGYGIYLENNRGSGNLLAPVVSVTAVRINEERDYLESSVKSCEKIVLLTNAAGALLYDQAMGGLFCNLGPGKDPNQL